MKRLVILGVLLLSLATFAQRPAQPERIHIVVADSAYALRGETTQTETRPGWKIVDIQTKSRSTRYLWGRHAKQQTDSRRPSFIIDITKYQLTDFAFIRLKEKKTYRKFPKADFMQCDIHRIGLDWMQIAMLADERYSVMPLADMEPGEYVLICLAAQPVNETGDMEVFPFTIP